MKIVILGGVAAGTKAAAKIKRENRAAEVELYTKSSDISYAGCGLPYYVGGDIETYGADRSHGIYRAGSSGGLSAEKNGRSSFGGRRRAAESIL